MKRSQIIALLVIFILLSVGVFLRLKRDRPELAQEIYTSIPITFDRKVIDRIELGRAEKPSVVLEKVNDSWQIASLWQAPADLDKVKRLMNDVHDLKGEKRSDAETLFADYGIQSEKAYYASFSKFGGTPAKLLMGTASRPTSSFVRVDGANTVYLADKPVLGDLGILQGSEEEMPNPEFWADLGFFPKTISGLMEIQVTEHLGKESGRTFKLKRVKTSLPENSDPSKKTADTESPKQTAFWTLESPAVPFNLNQAEVESLLRTFENGRGFKIVDPSKDYSNGKSGWTLNLVWEKEPQFQFSLDVVSLGEEEKQRWFLKNSMSRTVYEISSYTATQLTRGLGNYLEGNPFQIEPKSIQGVLLKLHEKELFLDRTEDKKIKFEQMLEVLKNMEWSVSLWKDALPEAKIELPYRLELRGSNDKNKVYLLGEVEAGDKKVFLLRPEGSNDLFSIDENVFRILTSF